MNLETKKPLPKLKRNKNLSMSRYRSYEGLPVMEGKGPLFPEYLRKLKLTFDRAIAEHPNTTLVRADLRFPTHMSINNIQSLGTDVISRFWASLKAQMDNHVQNLNFQPSDHFVWSTLRYVWCMEDTDQYGRVHYHVAFMVNYEVFKSLGYYGTNQGCLAGMVNEAWARALRQPYETVAGAVSFPPNPIYYIKTDEMGDTHGYEAAFHRVSYLAKSATKHYGSRRRHFDCSRV